MDKCNGLVSLIAEGRVGEVGKRTIKQFRALQKAHAIHTSTRQTLYIPVLIVPYFLNFN